MRERYYLLKRQNKIKTTMRLSAAMVFLSMLLCACTEASRNQELPAATYMGGKNTIAGICEELESAGASHVDTFREWTTDFADTAGKNAGLEDNWSDPGKMKADIGKCMDSWEQNHDYSDADCRMTAFLVFVGHTGVLIKYSDYYLFIEKIAFEQPYQATRVNNMDELLDIMSLRPEYFGEEGEAGPFVYCNGEYLGTLKKNI